MRRGTWIAIAAVALITAAIVWLTMDANNNKTADEPPLLLPHGMPIMSKPVELTFLAGKSPTSASNWNDVLLWQQYAAMTNIHVNFELVPFESLGEARQLALATGDYPDAFYAARLSVSELMKYGKDGVLIRLNDLIDQEAPNLKRLLEQYPDLRRSLTMPDGGIYSIPSFYDPSFLSMLIGMPLWINKDWLDALGMEEPQTTDDFYAYLKAVKEKDPNGNGIADEVPLASIGINELIYQLRGAWGLGNRGLAHTMVDWDERNGRLRFIPADPAYKEVLAYLHKLYAEGLIENHIFTISSSEFYAKGAKGVYGAMVTPSPFTLMKQTGYVGAPALQGPHGDRLYSHVKAPLAHIGAFAVTSKNKFPEATMRWVDHFFSEEGGKLFYMGIPGVSYVENADGELQYTEAILNNPNGLTMEQALAPYVTWLGGSYPGFVQQLLFKGSESRPESLEAARKVQPYAVQDVWPPFNLTAGSLGTELFTYVKEMHSKFITGEVPLSDWDNYVAGLKLIGLDNYMAMYEDAYEAYRNSP